MQVTRPRTVVDCRELVDRGCIQVRGKDVVEDDVGKGSRLCVVDLQPVEIAA
jgi:hypothetical protein